MSQLSLIAQSGVQFIWQTGRYYSEQIQADLARLGKPDNLHVCEFIKDMGKAYRAADLVISRAGAGSISELCLLQKACILIPSPNVAEDHQTKNARALADRDAAILITDAEAPMMMIPKAVDTVNNPEKLVQLSRNAAKLAQPDAARVIAEKIIQLAQNKPQ